MNIVDVDKLNPEFTVVIDGVEYLLKENNEAKLIWEKVIGKSIFQLGEFKEKRNENEVSAEDELMYFFHLQLKYNNKNYHLEYSEFVKMVYESEIIINELVGVFNTINELNADDNVKKK